MKQQIYKYIIAILLLSAGCAPNIRAQYADSFVNSGFNSFYFNPQNIGISDPQVMDFVRYGNLNINHYNGLLDMEIELDGYKDKDFDLPMSIKYISTGFIPSKRPSVVGYNWFLNFGGSVTRTVKGTPDDTKGKSSKAIREYLKDGLLVAIRNGSFREYTQKAMLDLNVENASTSASPFHWGDFKYDLEPDIFSFNFGKHSGSFIIGNTGTPVSLSGDRYKIDISGLPIQNYSTTTINTKSTIKITTPDGYLYEFGGSRNYLEYFSPNNPAKIAIRPAHITSWFLKKITAPNGRTVQFTYQQKVIFNQYNYFLYSYYQDQYVSSSCGPIYSTTNNTLREQVVVKDKLYSPILSSVTIDNGAKIEFKVDNGPVFFSISENDYSPLISNISYYQGFDKIKETNFNYLIKDRYFFLDNLDKNGQKYSFGYNLSKTLPNPLTTSLDHWGFWKGGNITTISNVENYCKNLLTEKSVATGFHDVALLNKVTYPTGGTSEITYQANYYRKFLKKNTDKKQIDLSTATANTICGGARVHKINDYDPVTQKTTNVRTFEYILPGTTTSSGVIGYEPKYQALEVVNYQFTEYTSSGFCTYSKRASFFDISANSLGFNENLPEYHIGYSDVIEKHNNGGYVHYKYSSQADADTRESVEDTKTMVTLIPFDSWGSAQTNMKFYEIAEKSGVYLTNNLSHFRGKLLEKKSYNSAGTVVQQETYTYNKDVAKSKYQVGLISVSRGRSSYKIYTTPCLLVKKEIKDQHNNAYTEFYSYGKNSLLAKQRTVNSDGKELAVAYSYISDFLYSSLTTAEKRYYDKNQLDKPLTITKTVKENGTEKTIESLSFRYGGETKSNLEEVRQLQGTAMNNMISYFNYDAYDNPMGVLEKGTDYTMYLWSYKGTLPVAVIKNVNYQMVEQKLTKALITALANKSEPTDDDMAKINNLRTLLPAAHITTYTYKPWKGINTITTPDGLTTYYEYDKRSRLKETYYYDSGDKCILEKYKYNYNQH